MLIKYKLQSWQCFDNFSFYQFGYLLDENADSKFDSIGMNAMSNKDKAGKTSMFF